MTTSLDSIAADMMAGLIRVKRNACADAGGPEDTVMLIDVRYADGHSAVGHLPDRDLLPFALANLAETHDAPIAVVGVLGDVFHREYDVKGGEAPPDPDHQRGEVTAAFHAGDLRVSEELMVMAYDAATRDAVALLTPYAYDDRGQPRFRAPRRMRGDDVQGQIMDYVREALR